MNNNLGYMICEASSEPKEMNVVSDKNGRVEIETIFQDLGVRNRNRRIYEVADFDPQLHCERTTELIRTRNLFGEAGHPMSTDLQRQSTVDLNNIAHCITKLWREDNIVKGRTIGTPNKQGQLFNDLILEGTIPSFSLRALGSIDNTPQGAKVKNIKLITYDWVVFPSHKKAYMEKIIGPAQFTERKFMTESTSIQMEHEGNKFIVDENYNGFIAPITNEKVIDYVKSESSNLSVVQESLEFLYEDIKVIDGGRRVMLSDYEGHALVVNLENYISNEIMNYCFKGWC